MEFIINHTNCEIVRIGDNSHYRKMEDIMKDLVDTYDYWSVDDDVSLIIYDELTDQEMSYVVELITNHGYDISQNDSAFFLFEDQHAMAEQYEIWVKEQEDAAADDCWNGWDTPYTTCDV
jgi:hypothetical protein